MFERQDIVPEKSVLGFAGRILRLTGKNPHYKTLAWFILIILATFSVVTAIEKRFWFGSVTLPVTDSVSVLGMSFIGDTMVWPFVILVPVCLVFTLRAAKATAVLLNILCSKIEAIYADRERPAKYAETMDEVKRIFRGQGRWNGKVILTVTWMIAAIFWGYNSLTNAYNSPAGIPYPYKSSEVILIKKIDFVRDIRRDRMLNFDVELPKWDANWETGPVSTAITRIWVLFFYGLLPFIGVKLIQMVLGLTYFLRQYRLWMNKGRSDDGTANNDLPPLLKPFNLDGYGGLSEIPETSMRYFYITITIVFLIFMSFFKEGTDPSWHNYVLIALLFPIALVAFLVPIFQARGIMRNAKQILLEPISERLNLMYDEWDKALKPNTNSSLDNNFHDRLSSLKIFYDEVDSIQEWPFSTSIVSRIVLIMLTPMIPILLEIVVIKLISGS